MAGRLAAIGIVTKDVPESCRFYRTLGLDVPEPRGQRYAQVYDPDGQPVDLFASL